MKLVVLALAALTLGAAQQHGPLMLRIGEGDLVFEEPKFFRYSDYFKAEVPAFFLKFKNNTGSEWERIEFEFTVTTPNGPAAFTVASGEWGFPSHMPIGAFGQIQRGFIQPYPYTVEARPTTLSVRLKHAIRRAAVIADLYQGLVMKDAECYEDFVAAMNAQGVAKRKKLTELMTYGCATDLPEPHKVSKILSRTKSGGVHAILINHDAAPPGAEGWIPTALITKGTFRDYEVFPKPLEAGSGKKAERQEER